MILYIDGNWNDEKLLNLNWVIKFNYLPHMQE